jgi:hypothetical protein
MSGAKSLLLGCSIGFFAITSAQAEDLPFKGKPVEYVKLCSLYGAGFFYIPGTGTCIKFGGAPRVQAEINSGVAGFPGNKASGATTSGVSPIDGRPSGSYAITDADVWSVMFPVQRNFWP